MMPLWTYVAETGTTFTTPQSMTCDVTRGAPDAPFYRLNDFLLDGDAGPAFAVDTSVPDAAPNGTGAALGPGCDDLALARYANSEPFFMNRATACTQEHGSKPTFVAVDDFDIGDISGVVQALNRRP
jgi:hypothetical protein